MKISASINVYDGYEFIELILTELRKNVDHVSVIYQTISYNGVVNVQNLKKTLLYLKNKGLIDNMVEYMPDFKIRPRDQECKKRNIGFELAKLNDCDYYLTLDADELYTQELFKEAKSVVEEGIDVFFTQIKSYYKYPSCFYYEPQAFKIPFLQRVRHDVLFKLNNPRIDLVDPTRILPYCTKKVLNTPVHHFSYIRTTDFVSKFKCSSNASNVKHYYKDLETSYSNFTETSTKAIIFRNWSFLEEVHIKKTDEITKLLQDYEWNSEQGIYTKRSI